MAPPFDAPANTDILDGCLLMQITHARLCWVPLVRGHGPWRVARCHRRFCAPSLRSLDPCAPTVLQAENQDHLGNMDKHMLKHTGLWFASTHYLSRISRPMMFDTTHHRFGQEHGLCFHCGPLPQSPCRCVSGPWLTYTAKPVTCKQI